MITQTAFTLIKQLLGESRGLIYITFLIIFFCWKIYCDQDFVINLAWRLTHWSKPSESWALLQIDCITYCMGYFLILNGWLSLEFGQLFISN